MKKILFLFLIMAVLISCKNEKTEDTPVLETEEIAVNYQTFGDNSTILQRNLNFKLQI